MSGALELYRLWRKSLDLRRAYQDAKTDLAIAARFDQGICSLVNADGCRWKVSVGYGPNPIVNVQAIAHLDDIDGPPGAHHTGQLDGNN
jgi:hypothetical protein